MKRPYSKNSEPLSYVSQMVHTLHSSTVARVCTKDGQALDVAESLLPYTEEMT